MGEGTACSCVPPWSEAAHAGRGKIEFEADPKGRSLILKRPISTLLHAMEGSWAVRDLLLQYR